MKLPQLPGYKYEELLGEGPCGWIFRCSWNNGAEDRVVKVLKSQATNRALVGSCLRALSEGKIKHPAFPEIYDTDFSGRPLAFAMPLYGHRDSSNGKWSSQSLESYCGSLPAEHCITLIDQFADAMSCLHRNGVFHVALKPGNLFVVSDGDDLRLKISDPGQGYIAGVQYLEMGDMGFYASPEQLETGDLSGGQGTLWDVYAFGVVSYRLLTGHLPRLDARYAQYRQNPDSIAQMPALAHGELLEGSETFLKWLALEQEIKWPNQPQSDREASRRFVIEKCLSLDPKERFSDMREVREALIQSDHQLQVNKLSHAAKTFEKSGVKRAKLWKAAALVSLGLFGASLIGTSVVYGMWKMGQNKQAKALTTVQQTVEQARAAHQQALKERENYAQTLQEELENMEVSKEELLGQAGLARQILRQIQANGDRFFALILKNRDSDVPGFELERARALSDGRKYYETLIDVYGGAPEFTLSMADAHRFLGEIYWEIGEFQKARESLAESATYYSSLLGVDNRNIDITKGIARVNQLQAAVSQKIGTVAQTLKYLDDSNGHFRSLASQQASLTFDATLEIAENFYEIAMTYENAGDSSNALKFAKASGDAYLNLRPRNPGNDRIVAGIARSFAITGDLLTEKGETKEATAAYQQAADLYAEAVRLNGSVDDHQLGLGKAMGQIGLLTKDSEKLKAASQVLAEVVPANPFKSEYQKTLAEVFGVLAQEQRDGGERGKAIELEQKAVMLLKPIVEGGSAVPAGVRLVYAKRLAGLAQLQGDGGQFSESREPLMQAIELLDELATADSTNAEYRRTLARTRGMAGFASAKAGDKTNARKHFEVAKVVWDNYVAQFPNDSQAAAEAKWTQEQLAGLQ